MRGQAFPVVCRSSHQIAGRNTDSKAKVKYPPMSDTAEMAHAFRLQLPLLWGWNKHAGPSRAKGQHVQINLTRFNPPSGLL